MYGLKNGELVRQFDHGNGYVENVVAHAAFIHGGRAMMTASSSGSVSLWDVEDAVVFNSLEHCYGSE